MINNAIEKLKQHAIELGIVALGAGITTSLLWAEDHLAAQYLSKLSPSTVIRIIALLILIFLWSCAYILYLRPCLKFLPKYGIFQDKKTGIYYCTSCKSKKSLSPLRQSASSWKCFVKGCEAYYSNPDYQQKEPPSFTSNNGRNSWMEM